MKVKVDSGELTDLVFNGYDTIEEYDKDAGAGENGVSAGMLDLNKSLVWRSTLPEFQDGFEKVVAELSGVARGVDEKATELKRSRVKKTGDEAKDAEAVAKVKDIPEKFIAFVRRAKAAMTAEAFAELQVKAREYALTVKVDASPSRTPSGPPKDALAKADSILTRGPDGIAETIAKMQQVVPDFELETEDDGVTPTRDSLARYVVAWREASL